jgi:hypothetical protein
MYEDDVMEFTDKVLKDDGFNLSPSETRLFLLTDEVSKLSCVDGDSTLLTSSMIVVGGIGLTTKTTSSRGKSLASLERGEVDPFAFSIILPSEEMEEFEEVIIDFSLISTVRGNVDAFINFSLS